MGSGHLLQLAVLQLPPQRFKAGGGGCWGARPAMAAPRGAGRCLLGRRAVLGRPLPVLERPLPAARWAVLLGGGNAGLRRGRRRGAVPGMDGGERRSQRSAVVGVFVLRRACERIT